MKGAKIFILALILINIETILGCPCGADKLKISPKPLDLKVNKAIPITKTTADGYTPIKIGYDFTTLKRPSSMTTSTYSLVKSLLQQTRVEFSKFVQVQHTNFDLSGSADDIMELCELDTIGAGYADFLVDNDVIIFPQFDSDLGSNVLAAAAPCIVTNSNRPYGGVLYINTNLNFNKGNTNQYLKNILLHEITHVLVFHPIFFNYFNMNTTENGISFIKSTKVLEKSREYFNCSSLTKIPLEDYGDEKSAGSHWESRYMLGDYMISTDYPDAAISDITLALFEDTGLYKVNYYTGGLFKFGKNKGCEFFNSACVNSKGEATFDEFCTTSKEAKCSSSRALKSSCYTTEGGYPTADYCPIPFEYHSDSAYFQKHCKYGTASESLEIMGNNSFCFMSSLTQGTTAVTERPVCYEVSCDTTNNKIIVTVGTATISCDDETVSNPSGLRGSITCPKYSDLCASPTNDGKAYNDMYNIFTKKAADDSYTYPTSYDDYTGNSLYEDDDDNITPVSRSDDYNIKINLILLAFGLLLFII